MDIPIFLVIIETTDVLLLIFFEHPAVSVVVFP